MDGPDKSDLEVAHRLLARAPARSASSGPGTPGRVFVTVPEFDFGDTSVMVVIKAETGLACIGDPVRLLLDDTRDDLPGLIWDAVVVAQDRVRVTFYMNRAGVTRPATTVQMRLEPYPRKKLFPEIRTELW